jgi:hypothetical protein
MIILKNRWWGVFVGKKQEEGENRMQRMHMIKSIT